MSNKRIINRHVPFVGKGFQPKTKGWIGYFVFFMIVAMLELGTTNGLISSLTMPKPSDVFLTMIELYESGMLFKHLFQRFFQIVVC